MSLMIKKAPTRGRPRVFNKSIALNKAMEIFWQNGYEGTSLANLTKAMGINPPSLYAAFGSKEKLFIEVISYYLENFGSYRITALNNAKTAKEGISDLLEQTVVQFLKRETAKGCLVVLAALTGASETLGVQQALAQERRNTVTLFEERIIRGVKEGDVSCDVNAHQLAEFYTTILFGLSIQARDGVAQEDLFTSITLAMYAFPS